MSHKTKYVCDYCSKNITEGLRVIVNVLTQSWQDKGELIFHYECFMGICPNTATMRVFKTYLAK